MESLFLKFDVTPDDPGKLNIIGFDLGAGESCACWIQNIAEKIEPTLLAWEFGKPIVKDFTAIRYGDDDTIYLGDSAKDMRGDGLSMLYQNFKTAPVGGSELEGYPDNSVDYPPTYRKLMQDFFQSLVVQLFKANPKLDRSLRTVLVVGRPSSSVWEDCAKEYQELLTEGLAERLAAADICDDQGNCCAVDVIVCSEAQAALAYECVKGNVGGEVTLMIIDGGSSTFDVTVIIGRKVAAEYSSNAGAGHIEDLMLDAALLAGSETLKQADARLTAGKAAREELRDAGNDLMKMRKYKERYFGDGNGGTMAFPEDCDVFRTTKKGGVTIRCDVDPQFMDAVLTQYPLYVRGAAEPYPSYSGAIEAFLREVRQKCEERNELPQCIILTGGATAMPFVKELTGEVFGEVPPENIVRAQNPSFTVPFGLGYLGYWEFLKQKDVTKIWKRIEGNQEQILSAAQTHLITALVDSQWTLLKNRLLRWSKYEGKYKNENYSINNVLEEKGSIPVASVWLSLQSELENSENITTVKNDINELFKNLFPDAEMNFQFRIPKRDIKQVLDHFEGLRNHGVFDTIAIGFWNQLNNWLKTKFFNLTPTREELYLMVFLREDDIRSFIKNNYTRNSDIKEAAAQIEEAITVRLKEDVENYIREKTPFALEAHQKDSAETDNQREG